MAKKSDSPSKQTYNEWAQHFMLYVDEVSSTLNTLFLNKLGLKIKIDACYDFQGTKWLATYQCSQCKLPEGVVLISLNMKRIYSEMRKRGIDNDDFNIEAQAKITIGHEVGHALCEYLIDYYEPSEENEDAYSDFIHDYYDGEIDEELETERFGEYLFPKATGTYTCRIAELMERLLA